MTTAAGSYPLPAHAASIWTQGTALFLALPASPGHSKGHTVHFDCSPEGLATAFLILKDRERTRGADYIGLAGAPDQARALHRARHSQWAAKGCAHCIAEGRFASSPPVARLVADGTVRVRYIPQGKTKAKQPPKAPAKPLHVAARPQDFGL